jgi:hypothetical protein
MLSEATERIGCHEKRLAYATIESLRAYVLLSEDRIQAEVYRREEGWHGRAIQEGSIPVRRLNVAVPFRRYTRTCRCRRPKFTPLFSLAVPPHNSARCTSYRSGSWHLVLRNRTALSRFTA